MSEIYDVIIIGAGPAGMAAAIYARRARLSCIVIEKTGGPGGQVLLTYEVENYPGIYGASGFDLAQSFADHCEKLGVEFVAEEVVGVELEHEVKQVFCEETTYEGRTVIIATGARHAKLKVPGESELSGRGVSYCATCDGAFFRNKTVAVVGGGDVAVEDAIFLARLCEKVHVIHRRNELRAAGSLQEALFALPNVEMVWNSVVEEIRGDVSVKSLMLKDLQTGADSELPVDGIFIAVGILPNSTEYTGKLNMSSEGYIVAGEDCCTSIPGVYAAGDVREKPLRQIITAASDGACAVDSARKYLAMNK